MARVIECYTDSRGRPLHVTVDVTPAWWPRAKRSAYGPVADCVAKAPYVRTVSLGFEGVTISRLLVKGEDLGAELETLSSVLEELGREWATPEAS